MYQCNVGGKWKESSGLTAAWIADAGVMYYTIVLGCYPLCGSQHILVLGCHSIVLRHCATVSEFMPVDDKHVGAIKVEGAGIVTAGAVSGAMPEVRRS